MLGLRGESRREGASVGLPTFTPVPHLHLPTRGAHPRSSGRTPFLLPRGHPLGTLPLKPGRSLVARCPLTAELPGTPISGCAVQTPLPKQPPTLSALPCRAHPLAAAQLPPWAPRSHNGPLSSAQPTPPARPPAPRPRQQLEVKLPRRRWCQPLSWLILPPPAPPALPPARCAWFLVASAPGCVCLGRSGPGWEPGKPLRQTLRAVPPQRPGTGWNGQLGPGGAKTSVPGRSDPVPPSRGAAGPGPSVPSTGAWKCTGGPSRG